MFKFENCAAVWTLSMQQLPYDCLREIILKFSQKSELHSCALVNRTWCRIAIPLLWQNPFRKQNDSCLKAVVDIYVHFFTPKQRQILQLPDPMTRPLFPYPSFLHQVDTVIFMNAVSEWLGFRHEENKITEFLHVIGRTIMKYSRNLMRINFRDFGQQDTLSVTLNRLMENELFPYFPSLSYLHFSNLSLGESPLLILLEYFPNIKCLEFSFCQNPEHSKRYLLGRSRICGKLSSLIIAETELNTEDICYVVTSASDELKIFEFRCSISVTPEILDCLAIYSTNLIELRIRLSDAYFLHFIKSLKIWTKLEYLLISSLDINKHTIGNNLPSFAASIPKSLKKLDILCNWNFDSRDLQSFFESCEAKLDYIYVGGFI
jgi:hypothetical protein